MNIGGRPTTYSEEITDEICQRISEGEALKTICSEDRMPCKSTVFKWLIDHKRFSDKYALAREEQAEVLADEIVSIADDGLNDTYIDENGNKKVDKDVVARSRLRVDARKWVASKLKPKVYGDRVLQEVTGANGSPLIPESVNVLHHVDSASLEFIQKTLLEAAEKERNAKKSD